ncbi:MAG: AIR synthase family protein [Lachnospiraceae bacterium]|nr:AIR synthase family protein [Lachnospiraceae bacterium]
MKIGKLPESVLKRCVLKKTNNVRDEVIVGAAIGEDCAAVQLEPDEVMVMSTDPITGTVKDIGELAVHITANDIACSGAEIFGIMLTILLPDKTLEEELSLIMSDVYDACNALNIQIVGGHTEVTKVVNSPLVSVTGVGKVKKDKLLSTGSVKPGMDIVMTKAIALEGTSIIAKEKESELLTHFPEQMIDKAKSFDKEILITKEAMLIKDMAVSLHDVTEGGIYGALWEMAEASGVGLDIELKKINVRQESIEICEYYKINPYKLISSGCLLIAAEDGNKIVNTLKDNDIEAVVIGKATDSNDRRLLNGDDVRFIETPGKDELYKVIGGRE